MLRLILMRHAEAEPAKGRGDHARPLSRRGRHEADAAARAFAHHLRPDLVITSDSARTVATVDHVTGALDPEPPRRVLPGLYGATPEAILADLRDVPPEARTVLVVGHNPGIGQLARDLARSGAPADLAALAAHFPTACFAVLAIDAPSWAEAPAPARLERLHGAKHG